MTIVTLIQIIMVLFTSTPSNMIDDLKKVWKDRNEVHSLEDYNA